MEKLLFTAFPICGKMFRVALEGRTARVNQYHHICDGHHDMDISITDTSLTHSQFSERMRALRAQGTHSPSLASTLEADDVTTATSAVYSALIYSFVRDIPKQKQAHGMRGNFEFYHDIAVYIYKTNLFELYCPFASKLLKTQTIIFF